LTTGSFVPGPRIGADRGRSNIPRFNPLARRFQLGDPIEDGAVENGQFFGGRVRLHGLVTVRFKDPHGNSPAVPFPSAERVSGQSPE